jgi:MYXO-CTERM domain-containing protein
MRRRSSFAILMVALLAGSARADVGEIAVIEDKDGAINAAGLFTQDYLGKASCAFLAAHPDRYDALVFFTTIEQSFLTGTPAGWRVKPTTKGIGLDLWFDASKSFCSPRLRHAIRMGDLAALPDNPDALYGSYPWTGIEVLGHEMGHQWLAYVNFQKPDGIKHCLLRGFNASGSGQDTSCDGHGVSDFGVHWSFYFNTGSLMYGNVIEELGGGQFRLEHRPPRFSALDQYLMGLRGKEEVPPMFLVDVGDPAGSDSGSLSLKPGESKVVSGTRLDLTVDDIIRAEGPRVPAVEGCHWKTAFAIVHAAGKPPSAAQIAKVDAYRKRWETFYGWATDGRGSVDTTLAAAGAGTPGCPASGIRPDAGAPATSEAAARDAGGEAAGAGSNGCGCAAGGRADGSPVLLGLLALLALRRRR